MTPDDQELFYELCHRLRFFAWVALDGLDDRAADHRCVRELADGSALLGSRDPEADSDGQGRMPAQAADQFLGVVGQLPARSGHAGAGDRIDKSA